MASSSTKSGSDSPRPDTPTSADRPNTDVRSQQGDGGDHETHDQKPSSASPKSREPSARAQMTPLPAISPRYKRSSAKSLKQSGSRHSDASVDLDPESRGVYITEFSEDGENQSDFSDEDDRRSINVLDDDDEEGDLSSGSLPPPAGVDIYNPAGYDTDLDVDEDGEDELTAQPQGIKDYIQECNRLGVIPVSYFKRHVHDVDFVMRYHGLGPLGAKAIAKPLETNTTIETLDLEGNAIGGEGVIYLSKYLSENYYITKLVLSENALKSEGAEAVCNMLKDNSTILDVDLAGNGFKDSDGEIISEMLKANQTIRSLNLRHNEFETEAGRWIRDGMVTNSSLRQLDLSWNHFRLKGAEYIAELIQENYGLKYLNLAMNGLGTDGAATLGKALVHNQCLEELNLSNNRIGDEGAVHLARGLAGNDTLAVFRFGMNPLTPTGSQTFLSGLYQNDNSSVHLLDLTNIVVTQEFETFLNDNLRQEKTRMLQVIHGGVLFKKKQIFNIQTDLEMAFASDPMTKIHNFADRNKLRLVDVFRWIDRDQNQMLSHSEFLKGVEKLREAGFELTRQDISNLIQRLDKNGDGCIDYKELMEGSNGNRKAKRKINEWLETKKEMTDQGVQTIELQL